MHRIRMLHPKYQQMLSDEDECSYSEQLLLHKEFRSPAYMLQLLLLSEGTRFLPSPPYRLLQSLSNHRLRQEQIQALLP